MKKRKRLLCVFLSAMVFMTGGCVDIRNRPAPANPVMATVSTEASITDIPDAPVTVSVATTTASRAETTTIMPDTSVEIEEFYSTFEFLETDYEFLGNCVFVGDSICSGLGHYGIIPMERVIAQGNIAARNIFDFTFTVDGGEQSLLTALVNANPKYVVFSMGINDVNITSEQEFMDNYREILKMTEGFLPNARLIILSVTPIDITSTFTTNENIDGFNEVHGKLADENDRWFYADVTKELKNSENALKTNYSSGDGIHLAPDAYNAVLYQLCRLYLGGGEFIDSDTTSESEEITIE